MKSFLSYVADDILQTFGCDLQDIVVVFPNKRANLFLNEWLAEGANQPLWAPNYMSIADLFHHLSPKQTGDPILLVSLLYNSYLKVTGKTENEESLDQFFAWGEILLADFDDVDKNMVDASRLFRNLKELKDLDADIRSYLSSEQLEALQAFFQKFQFEKTELQEKFTKLWDVLGLLYADFNQELAKEGLCYEGALYRQVVNELTSEQLTAKCYLFVGFNVLDKVEETLFQKIQSYGKARFYWDYDTYYLDPKKDFQIQEAGHFLARNVKQFGNALSEEALVAMRQPKQVEYVSAPTDSAQIRYVDTWLQQHPCNKESAVVLCNEHLLEPVLHVLPDQCKINITMGFPMSDTPVFSFIQTLCHLYEEGYSKSTQSYRLEAVSLVLLHPYATLLSPKAKELLENLKKRARFLPKAQELQWDERLKELFPEHLIELSPVQYILQQVEALAQQWKNQLNNIDSTYLPLYQESLFKAYTLCNRIQSLVDDGILRVSNRNLVRFLFQLVGSQNIPFHGEPAEGLQVMGVLETRNLNFRNVILLSVNEGMLPKNGAEASFIPYNLRRAFGMTLIEQKIAVYAYYFYRLIQRAEQVTMVYNNNTEGLQKGEMSRFMQQYLVEHPENHSIRQLTLSTKSSSLGKEPLMVSKTPEMVQQMLASNARHNLSPSALNQYINCPLQYYLSHVAHLKVEEDVTDVVDNALFGTMLHRCAELIYRKMMTLHDGTIYQSFIEDALKNQALLMEIVKFVLKECLFQVAAESHLEEDSPEYMEFIRKASMPELNGNQTIIQSVILRYVQNLLEFDKQLTPFRILGLEKQVETIYPIQVEGYTVNLKIGGTLDRLDEYTNLETNQRTIRVVDYKTSANAQTAKNMDALFDSNNRKRPYHITQAFYYALQVDANGLNPHHEPIAPTLFYVTQANAEYRPEISIGGDKVVDFMHDFASDYKERLTKVLEEMYNVEVPFTQAATDHPCEFCDFRALCGR